MSSFSLRNNFASLVAMLVAILFLAAPNQARAGFAITVFVDGVNQGVVLDGGSTATDFYVNPTNVGNFRISNIDATTNWSGAQGGALMSTGFNAKIQTDFGPTGGTHTITIVISEDGWLAPVGSPLILSQSAGGSIANTDSTTNPNRMLSVAATAQGYLDSSALNSMATTLTPGGNPTPLAVASATLIGTNTDSLVYNPNQVAAIVPGATPFTLTSVYSFTVTTDGDNKGSFNVSGSLVASVPAPAGLVLAVTGLPALGLGAWLRRRRQGA